MNERISLIRKKAGLTQEEFGEKVGGLSRNYIWMVEKGERVPSDRTISDICRIFNVNENWLRTGEGEMFNPKSRNEELMDFATAVAEGDPGSIQAQILTVMARLTDAQWEVLAQVAKEFVEETKKAGLQ